MVPCPQERRRGLLLLDTKLWQLSPAEVLLLLRALFALIVATCIVHLLPYRVLQRRLRSLSQIPPAPRTGKIPAEPIALAVNRASRFVPGAACLTRALAVGKLLASEGYPARIQFGVAQPTSGHLG